MTATRGRALTWEDVFEPTPGSWGLRGDPYAWFMLRARLCSVSLDDDAAQDRAVLVSTFHEVVGLDLDDRLLPETLYCPAYAFGGMSSGSVDLHRWRDVVVPMLVQRAADLRAGAPAGSWSMPAWQGVVRASPTAVHADAERLADAAKGGNWDDVMALLAAPGRLTANSWRPTGQSLYTPLHHAAWHGAPAAVAERLVELGAWRTLRTAKGERPIDIARRKGHKHLLSVLEPVVRHKLSPEVVSPLDVHLAALVESRTRPRLETTLRHPQCEVLTELPMRSLWYPVPGMHGGFRIELREDHLYVTSWSRVVGGSGQAHLVTRDGAVLVARGFV